MMTFADTIRLAAQRDGRTAYALAKASGLNVSMVARFLSGERGLTLDSAERLARVLGLAIIVQHKRQRKER